jgi:dihydrofolate reductase
MAIYIQAEGGSMEAKRRIIVYIATSADGFIARPNGNMDWLMSRPHPPGSYGMAAFFRSIDTILWGRKTYDESLKMGDPAGTGTFGMKVRNYVFSRHPPKSAPPGIEFVKEPVKAFAKRLRSKPGKDIWIMGGGELIASFLDAGEVDEFSIHVIPVFIGEGIPLIAPKRRLVPLELKSTRRFPDGVVHLNYRVAP